MSSLFCGREGGVVCVDKGEQVQDETGGKEVGEGWKGKRD